MSALELKVPPVALVLVHAAIMWLLAKMTPSLSVTYGGQSLIVAALTTVGALISLAGVIAFRRAHTTVDPTRPEKSTALVATGVYRISRNPMYVGLLLLLAAWAAHLANLAALVALPVFVAYMQRFQIIPEERALREKFGHAFIEYEQSVCRWL
jgi:protein-S-isoprenylcysteine O-methyltransferase Ste14